MTTILWISFILLIVSLLVFDLFFINKKDHVIAPKEALFWTGFWIFLALIFNFFVYYIYENHWFGIGLSAMHEKNGQDAALNFLTGFIIEKSLSLDNIFVIALIFQHFRVPLHLQHRVLFWGIIGAMFFRGVLIGVGSVLLAKFTWVVYIFGGLLLFTAVRLLVSKEEDVKFEENILIKLISKIFLISKEYNGNHFFTKINNKTAATPLLLALLVVETVDVIFAIDSIPAIFAITYDPFIVFTSNVFAILGMRSLYFALAYMMDKFTYLKSSLVFVLAYVGTKIMFTHYYKIPTLVSLAIIMTILGIGVIASIYAPNIESDIVNRSINELKWYARLTLKQTKRLIIIVVGLTILLFGVAMIITPGPAILVIPLGLAILGTEFLWARRMLSAFKKKAEQMKEKLHLTKHDHEDEKK